MRNIEFYLGDTVMDREFVAMDGAYWEDRHAIAQEVASALPRILRPFMRLSHVQSMIGAVYHTGSETGNRLQRAYPTHVEDFNPLGR